jgi:hypothetical protein
LGITDGQPVRHGLANRRAIAPGKLSSVILEGINNSTLDLLRDGLLDQVTGRVGGSGRVAPTILFASVADGSGAFPLESSYLELGPIFDLEQLDWQHQQQEKAPFLGSAPQDVWLSIAKSWEGKPVDYEEALRGVRKFASRRNARIELNVTRAFAALKGFRVRPAETTALQSLTFGWLAPYWLLVPVQPDDIDSEIDGGKCDTTSVDLRLKRMLDEYRAAQSGGAQ